MQNLIPRRTLMGSPDATESLARSAYESGVPLAGEKKWNPGNVNPGLPNIDEVSSHA